MRAIIEKIAAQKDIGFSEKESSWFNGEIYQPLKTFNLQYPVKKGILTLDGEYRRQEYRRADIYIWNFSMRTQGVNHDFTVSQALWLARKLLKKPPIKVVSQDPKSIEFLGSSKAIRNLYFGQKENIDCRIKGKYEKGHFTVRTILYSEYNHESIAFATLTAFEEINSFLTEEDY